MRKIILIILFMQFSLLGFCDETLGIVASQNDYLFKNFANNTTRVSPDLDRQSIEFNNATGLWTYYGGSLTPIINIITGSDEQQGQYKAPAEKVIATPPEYYQGDQEQKQPTEKSTSESETKNP